LQAIRRALPASQGSASVRGRNLNNGPTSIGGRIQCKGKKYLIFYRLWVPEKLFPLSPQPNFDPRSPLRWTSPQGKCDGARAELYGMLPQEMHETAETLTKFPSMVCSTVHPCILSLINTVRTSSVLLSILSGQVSSMHSKVSLALYLLSSVLIPESSLKYLRRRTTRVSSGSCTERVKPTPRLVLKMHTTA